MVKQRVIGIVGGGGCMCICISLYFLGYKMHRKNYKRALNLKKELNFNRKYTMSSQKVCMFSIFCLRGVGMWLCVCVFIANRFETQKTFVTQNRKKHAKHKKKNTKKYKKHTKEYTGTTVDFYGTKDKEKENTASDDTNEAFPKKLINNTSITITQHNSNANNNNNTTTLHNTNNNNNENDSSDDDIMLPNQHNLMKPPPCFAFFFCFFYFVLLSLCFFCIWKET